MPHPTHKKNHKNRPWSKRGESTPSAEHLTCDLVLGALDEGLLLPEELVEDAAAGAEGLPLRDRVVVPHRARRRRRRAPPSRGRGAGGEVRRRRWHQRPECGGRHHLRPLFAVNSVGFEYQNCEWIGSGELHNAARQASVRVERIRIVAHDWNFSPFCSLVLRMYRIIIFENRRKNTDAVGEENRRKNTHPCQFVGTRMLWVNSGESRSVKWSSSESTKLRSGTIKNILRYLRDYPSFVHLVLDFRRLFEWAVGFGRWNFLLRPSALPALHCTLK